MRKIIILFTLLTLLIGGAYFIHRNKQQKSKTIREKSEEVLQQEEKELAQTKRLLKENKPKLALEIIQKHENPGMIHTEKGREWLQLLLDCYVMQNDSRRIYFIYNHLPEIFNSHEAGTLSVLHSMVDEEKAPDIEAIRNEWKGKETLKNQWLLLDADILTMQGKREEAKKALLSMSFKGREEVTRLVKLAFLSMSRSPKEALQYLVDAQKKDPLVPHIYLLRAKILETAGKVALANFEYTSALKLFPQNPMIRDELAEFHRRQSDTRAALDIWTNSLQAPSLDTIWIKTLFWSKVAHSAAFNTSIEKPQTPYRELIDYLIALPENSFWNTAQYEKLENGKKFLHTHQSTFWLRVIQLLKDKKEKEAWGIIEENPLSKISWEPLLEKALHKVLQYRLKGTFSSELFFNKGFILDPEMQMAFDGALEKKHPLFLELNTCAKKALSHNEEITLPKELNSLLKSPYAFSALFLAAGWEKAACALLPSKTLVHTLPENLPLWYTLEMTQAIRSEKGIDSALKFAQKQTASPELQFHIASLQLFNNQIEQAKTLLQKLIQENGPTAFAARHLLTQIYMKEGVLEKGKELIAQNKELQSSVQGKELLAEMALMEKNEAKATQIYLSIESESIAAKSFLAQKAFHEKNFKRAKKLTDELLQAHPNNPAIQANWAYLQNQEKQFSQKKHGQKK